MSKIPTCFPYKIGLLSVSIHLIMTERPISFRHLGHAGSVATSCSRVAAVPTSPCKKIWSQWLYAICKTFQIIIQIIMILKYLISGEIIFSELVSARRVVPLAHFPSANWEHFSSSLVSLSKSRSTVSRWNKIKKKKENVYLSSLMMKVPDHVHVLG
jgi:hypothetical protein